MYMCGFCFYSCPWRNKGGLSLWVSALVAPPFFPVPAHPIQPSLSPQSLPPPHNNTTGKKKAGHGAEQGDSLYGIALLGLSLLMDGVTGATQVGGWWTKERWSVGVCLSVHTP